mgnify:CR=1 FL=1
MFAPVTERLIALAGWVNAMFVLAALMLATLPLAGMLRRGAPACGGTVAPTTGPMEREFGRPRLPSAAYSWRTGRHALMFSARAGQMED